MTYIEVKITKCVKSYNPKDSYAIYDDMVTKFDTIEDAKEWLEDEYGTSKRQPMYVDDKDGKSKKIGYVIGFRNYDFVDGKRVNFIEQHWIGFEKVEDLEI